MAIEKKKTGSVKTVKGKSKKIRIRTSEGIMDGNSVQMPFLAPYNGERITYVEYEWTTTENGKTVKRGINVTGHGKLGVPTLREKEVLRVLQDIYIWSKVDKGVLELETDISKITDEDLTINFVSIDNLATQMGFTNISGQQRKALKESIEILVASTMFSVHEGGIYDPVNKKYITNSKESKRYLGDLKDYTVCDCENCLFSNGCSKRSEDCQSPDKSIDITKIKMDINTYLTIANNYRLYYNKDNCNKIKNLVARNIYMISRKWIGDGYISKAHIQKYMDRIPMNAKQEKHRKQAIKKYVMSLNKYDFVEANVEKDIVTIVHLDKKPTNKTSLLDELATDMIEDKSSTDSSYMKDKFVKYSDFKEGMIDIGFTEKEFIKLMDKFIEKIEYLKALLRYVIIKSKYEEINKKEYFANCLNKGIQLDTKYYSNI